MSNSFGCPFRRTAVGSTCLASSVARRSSCKRRVNRLYSIGELCADEFEAEAVELLVAAELKSNSKGFCWVAGAGGGLRIFELKRVCMAGSGHGNNC